MGEESCNSVVHVIVTTSAVLLDCILAPALTLFYVCGALFLSVGPVVQQLESVVAASASWCVSWKMGILSGFILFLRTNQQFHDLL